MAYQVSFVSFSQLHSTEYASRERGYHRQTKKYEEEAISLGQRYSVLRSQESDEEVDEEGTECE